MDGEERHKAIGSNNIFVPTPKFSLSIKRLRTSVPVCPVMCNRGAEILLCVSCYDARWVSLFVLVDAEVETCGDMCPIWKLQFPDRLQHASMLSGPEDMTVDSHGCLYVVTCEELVMIEINSGTLLGTHDRSLGGGLPGGIGPFSAALAFEQPEHPPELFMTVLRAVPPLAVIPSAILSLCIGYLQNIIIAVVGSRGITAFRKGSQDNGRHKILWTRYDERWRYSSSHLSVGQNETVHLLWMDHGICEILSYAPNGELITSGWSAQMKRYAGAYMGGLATDSIGNAYFALRNTVICLDASGVQVWSCSKFVMISHIVIAPNRGVLVADLATDTIGDSYLVVYLLCRQSGKRLRKWKGPRCDSAYSIRIATIPQTVSYSSD